MLHCLMFAMRIDYKEEIFLNILKIYQLSLHYNILLITLSK